MTIQEMARHARVLYRTLLASEMHGIGARVFDRAGSRAAVLRVIAAHGYAKGWGANRNK